MKTTRSFLALMLAMLLAFSLVAGISAEPQSNQDIRTELAEDYTGKTVILHSNDVHGNLSGYAYIAGLRSALQEKGAEVILADAGDFSNGTPYVSISKGSNAIEMMNAAGYDVVTLGNHEFDFGYAQLMENLKKAEFKTICSDVYANGKLILDSTAVITTDSGLKLGFFGMETPETATKVKPDVIKEISFATFDDLYASAQLAIDALKSENVDLIICLSHLGVDKEAAGNGYRSSDLYAKVTGLDFMLDGHSHTVMTVGEAGEPIQSTGTKFAYVGVVVIDNATKKIEDHFLMATEETDADGNVTALLPKDEATAAKAAELNNEVDSVYGAPFAKSEVELNGEKAPNGNRDSQTNNGNLITDSILWYVINTGSITKVDASNIVAITNGGGIRAPIKPGDVSRKDINSVLPFGNTVAVIYVTGEQLLETLEASTYELPIGGYPQTAGIKWTLDTSKTFERGDLYIVDGKETSYYAPKSIQRVSIQSINGKDFDPAAMYAVVTNNFIAVGGDTYAAFHEAYLRTDEYAGFDTSIPLDEAVVEYVTTELKGLISAEKYSTDRGDLTMLPLVEAVPASTTGLSVNGTEAEAEHYTVGGEDYYKLRDIAALLTGTNAQFDVSYDAASDTVLVTTGTAYAAVGGELVKGADRSAALIPSPHSISVDGSAVSIGAYIVDGTNFFRLADLADIIGFTVETDANGAVAIAA